MHTQVEFVTSANVSGPRKKPLGFILAGLIWYLDRRMYLRDRSQPLTPDNVKTLWEITKEVGYRSPKSVSHVIRRDYPEVAAVVAQRDPSPDRRSLKKDRLFQYIGQGQHLKDPEGELEAANLKSQKEIAGDLGMHHTLVSHHIREHFPAIAAVMTNRKRYDREE